MRSDLLEAASYLQASVRRWLAISFKNRLRQRRAMRERPVGKLIQKIYHRIRFMVFIALVSSTARRLAAVRAEVTAKTSHEVAMLALGYAIQARQVAWTKLTDYLRAEAGAKWLSDYVAERVSNPIPTQMRQLLVRKSQADYKLCSS